MKATLPVAVRSRVYRVSIPARQHPYTEEEIAAVVDVMRNVEGQTQGAKMAQFQEDFAAFTAQSTLSPLPTRPTR